MFFFYFRIQFGIPHCIWPSCLLLTWSVRVSHSFLVFKNVKVMKELVFCRMTFKFESVWSFLMIKLGLRIWGKNAIEVKYPHSSLTVGGTWSTWLSLVMLTLVTCLRWWLPNVFTLKSLFFSFPCFVFWKKATKSSPE